ncbi:PorP/SprF family type IX secretion system membrane protein [Mucilaginibacter paludis]|uniref:Membrane protein n=1 Tax=Mucilaginibacter paludis DSM 18603 TaxID=714943 RepID=H1Y757_9SPHI|nr:PorP/SprF family type IX secretion system membrane protein [Mucilaginibacter paludis]EHQ28676.1 putative membrane protein [Mucilaginibacter paludis DSM 18603]
MIKKIFSLILCLLFTAGISRGQDHLYSQFYNSPNYLNPALNGQFEGSMRMNLIYRSQWTNIPGPLNYYSFSMDFNIPRLNGGLGLLFTKSSEGTAYLDKINIAGIYSYSAELNNGALSFGLQAGMTNRKVDQGRLVYLDQLNDQGIIPGGTSAGALPELNNRFFFDAGAGVNLVLGDMMIGASGQHLNKPNESLSGGTSPLPIRFNTYASWKITLNPYIDESPSVIPSVVFNTQAGVNNFSAGMQYKNKGVNVGLWYRGTGQQNDAIVVSVIFDLFGRDGNDKTRLGLSHDITTSSLPYSKTAGSTEGALSYETTFPGHGKYDYVRRSDGNRCYDFY